MTRQVLLAVLAGIALGAASIPPAHAAPSQFSWSGAIDAEGGLTVRIHEGDVTIRPATGSEASVSARLRGRREEIGRIELEAVERDGAIELIAGYPPRRNREEPVTNVRIDVEILVPAGVKVVARTEKGHVEAIGLDGPVDAATAVGNIEISTSSWARGRSVNGNVRAEVGSTDWEGELAFATVNGDIEVTVPEAVDSQVTVHTRNGSFTTDLFPVERRRGIPGARLSGKIGHGGERRLALETVNGDIRLRSS
jgi:hypothetical protein